MGMASFVPVVSQAESELDSISSRACCLQPDVKMCLLVWLKDIDIVCLMLQPLILCQLNWAIDSSNHWRETICFQRLNVYRYSNSVIFKFTVAPQG